MRAVLNMLGFTFGGGLSVGLNVLSCLERIAPHDRFLALVPNVPDYLTISPPCNCELRVFDVSSAKRIRRLWLDHIAIPMICRQFEADVLFSMSNFGPYAAPCSHVLGIHLGHLASPGGPVWRRLSLRERFVVRAQVIYLSVILAHVDRMCVLTGTAATKMSVAFRLGADRISVVPNASPTPAYKLLPDTPRVRDCIKNCGAQVRLCYPAIGYPHKNHEILPETFRALREDYGIEDVVVFVTVEESDSDNSRRFLQAVHAMDLSRQIINLGRLNTLEVPTLYRYCQGLLMPTLLETLSLSYLEAFEFGIPVLTSDLDFAHEVCGSGAIYFDPMNPRDIARVIARFRQASPASASEQPAQVQRTWSEVTAAYLAVLRAACGDSTMPPHS